MQSRLMKSGCAWAIACALLAASCGGKAPEEHAVFSVMVAPDTATIKTGATVQLVATARNAHGDQVSCVFTWTSSAPNIARVSDNGLVTGVSGGIATITATCQGQSGQAVVTVMAATGGPQLIPAALAFDSRIEATHNGGGWDISVTSNLTFSPTPQTALDSNLYYTGQAPLTHRSAIFTLPSNPGCTVTRSWGTDGVLKAYVPVQTGSVQNLRVILAFDPQPMESATIHCEQPPYPPIDRTEGPSAVWFAGWVVSHGPPGQLGWEITSWQQTAPLTLVRMFDQSGTVNEHTELTLTLVQIP